MRTISAAAYEALFSEQTPEQSLDDLRHKQVAGYRTKAIRAGDMLECEIYPILRWGAVSERARKAKKKSREAQARLNAQNAIKRTIRRANASFTDKDLFITLTYATGAPNESQARNDIQLYIRRLRGWRMARGLPEMQYIYSMEFDEDGTAKRAHHHILMTGMDRDAAERLWRQGRCNSRRLQPGEQGLAEIVRYMTKSKRGRRHVVCSRNITEPVVTSSDRKVSRRKVERVAMTLPPVAAEVFERAYPEYRLVDIIIKRSDYIPGAYLYVTMARRGCGERAYPATSDRIGRPKEARKSNEKRAQKPHNMQGEGGQISGGHSPPPATESH